MTIEPLGDAWFDAARDLVTALPVRPGVSCSVQFEAGDVRWHQVVVDGQVTAWSRGDLPEAQLVVRMPLDVARAIHRPDADGSATLARCTVVRPDGTEEPAPPMDLLAQPGLASLPELPGADLTVAYHLARGPFGDVEMWQATVDGRLVGGALAPRANPDVEIWAPFRAMADLRAGTRTILELLAEGVRVEGEEGPLMLFAGLEEGPELRAVKQSCGPAAAILGDLGEVRADPVFQSALAALAGDPA